MGRRIGFISGKGGVGKSTLIANIGAAIGSTGKRVVIVDADLGMGILLSAYTEFFFLKDYHLGIEFIILTQNPTSLTTMLFVAFFVIAIIIVAFGFVVARLQPKMR